MNSLSAWQSYYALVGSAAGALIGLQFVLMALIAELPAAPGLGQATSALATPTVVHFSAALFLAGLFSAPWRSIGVPSAVCGAAGLAGFAYVLVVAGRMRRQTAYRPVPSDWFFYVALPSAAYAGLSVSAYAVASGIGGALYGVATSTLLLVFAGINNAWDSVTYHVFVQRPARHAHNRD